MIQRGMAFSLVELLVVIALLTMLAALLLPSLQRAMYIAKDTACMNQQKQVSCAVLLYAGDFYGFLPYTFGNTGITYNVQRVAASPSDKSWPKGFTGLGYLCGLNYVSQARLLWCANEDTPELLEASGHPTMGAVDMQKTPPPRQINNDTWFRCGGWVAEFVPTENIARIRAPDDGLLMCGATGANSVRIGWDRLHQARGFSLSFVDGSTVFYSYAVRLPPALWGGVFYRPDYPQSTLNKAARLYRNRDL